MSLAWKLSDMQPTFLRNGLVLRVLAMEEEMLPRFCEWTFISMLIESAPISRIGAPQGWDAVKNGIGHPYVLLDRNVR